MLQIVISAAGADIRGTFLLSSKKNQTIEF